MRTTCILLLSAIFYMNAAEVRSQTTRVNISKNTLSVYDMILAIEDQTEYLFLYNEKDIDLNRKIQINGVDKPMDEVLHQAFSGTDISYSLSEEYISLRKKASASPVIYQQGKKQITGIVTDSYGEGVIGANIVEVGTANGVITNINGEFTLSVSVGSTIRVTYIGYASHEEKITESNHYLILLNDDALALNEVVAIGYGVKKKVNLTGSTSFVSATELTNRVAPNTSNLLQGKVSGLQLTQSGGQPGNDGSRMRIRGMGTFSSAGSDPMILVDGVQGDLSNLNSQDIESISVLKDAASAAIYGARAANGVILVTTKQGSSGLNIEYHGNFQMQNATRVRDLVTNSADFMTAFNAARERNGQSLVFTDEEINNFRTSSDPIKYPNFNWRDHMLNTGLMQNHHISFNGGNEKTKFNFSLGYMDQSGIMNGYDYKRLNGLLNFSSKISSIFTIGANVNIKYQNRNEPVPGNEMFFLVYAAAPNFLPQLSDGSGKWARTYKQTQPANRNPEAVLEYGNNNERTYSLSSQAYIDVNFTKELIWTTKVALNYDDRFFKSQEKVVAQYNYNDNSDNLPSSPYTLGVRNHTNKNILTTFFSTLTYDKTFLGTHNLNVMTGYSQEQNNYRFLNAYRPNMPFDNLTELNAGSAEGQSLEGNLQEWAIRSLFGRISYDYLGKYLFEANVRYDGTSRIISGNRWGAFPSFSGGWRLSQEEFMSNLDFLTNLKVRASWGQLGNQNIGLYPYQDLYVAGLLYPFNSIAESGAAMTRMTDKDLRWEKTSVLDFGLDLSIYNGLFSMSFDWFNKITDGIIANIDIPASIGLSSPITNFAKMENKGVEFEFGHSNKIGQVSYSINANLATFRNKVIKVTAPSYGTTTIQEGQPYGSFYLTEWIGIFQSQEDIDNSPSHRNNPKPGDLKFKDQNNDNQIDGDDRVIMDGAFPKFYYGGSVDIFWKNFDLNLFFQGVQGQKHYISGVGIEPFDQGGAPTKEFFNNSWTPENGTNKYPAMYASGYGAVSGTASSYFLADASYFRLKSFILGYNFPSAVCNRIGLKNLRLYLSGDNVFTITKYPYADPDRLLNDNNTGDTFIYPQLRSFSFGVNIKY